MPTTQTPFSEYQIALMQAQRQQQLADALRQQSFQPIESYDSGVLKAPISYTQGLAKTLQAYAANKGQEKAIENMGKAYGLQYDMLRNMYGGGQPQTPPVPAGSTATDVQGNTFRTNTLPPYLQNQQPIPVPSNGPQTPQQSQSMPSQQNMNGMPMGLRLPPGQTPESMASLSLLMPQVAGPLQAEWMKPDPTTLAAMNAGYTPQQTADIQRRTLEKGAYIAPLNIRPGSIPSDPYTGMPLPSAPAIGAAQANNAALIERAKQSNTPITVQGPQGQPITGWTGTVLGSGSGHPQASPAPQTAPTGTGQTPSNPLTSVPNYGPGIQGQTTVGKSYAESAAKAGSDYESSLNDAASNALTQNKMLDELQGALTQFTPGKAAALRKSIAEWKVQTGMATDQDKQIAASGEVGDKLTGQLVSNALRSMSARPSQMEFQIFLSKFVPNLEMTPQGAQQVVEFMRQQNNLNLEKQQTFSQQWKPGHTPDQYRDFETAWNQKAAGMPLSSPQSFGTSGVQSNPDKPRSSLVRNPDGSFTYVPR